MLTGKGYQAKEYDLSKFSTELIADGVTMGKSITETKPLELTDVEAARGRTSLVFSIISVKNAKSLQRRKFQGTPYTKF